MKRPALLIVLIIYALAGHAQFRSVSSLIKKLDNSEFIIDHSAKASFSMQSKSALKLIKIGHRASQKLVNALADSTKNIMAHLILCHIYYKVATFAGPKVITVNEQHISNYFLGQKSGEGLIISEINNNGIYKIFVSPENLEAVKKIWEAKIHSIK